MTIELTCVVPDRIVSVSELLELIVDMVRSEAMLDALSESEYDVAIPTSCLGAPQWILGMDVWL